MGANRSPPSGTLYRTCLEGMYNHVNDDAAERVVIPDGVPYVCKESIFLYRELKYDEGIRRHALPNDEKIRFAEEWPAGYRIAAVRIEAKKDAHTKKRTLRDIICGTR